MQSELQMKMYTALLGFMATASQAQMAIMGDLIRLSFGLQWTTDHEMILAEKVGTDDEVERDIEGKLITKEQKAQCREAWATMSLELGDYHSEQ